MDTKTVEQLEITRHTIRRLHVWSSARWFFVPALVFAISLGGSAIVLGYSPLDLMRRVSLPSEELLQLSLVVGVGLVTGLITLHLINHSRANLVFLVIGTIFSITVLTWAVALLRHGEDLLIGSCIASLILSFVLYVTAYSFRANHMDWLSNSSDEDRENIDAAARRL